MSDKKLNAIKEIEFRIESVKSICDYPEKDKFDLDNLCDKLNEIDNLLYDINDFINDLKDDKI